MPKIFDTESQLDREVLFIIRMHKGQDNAIRRWDLCVKVYGEDTVLEQNDRNTYDRTLRRSIERLRRQGYLIANLGSGDGYFLVTTREEYQSFRNVYGAHAFPIMETIREMDKAAAQEYPNPLQPSLM